MKNKNILIFPCGSEIGLEIHNSLKYFKYFTLFGGSSVNDHGRMVFKNYIDSIPFISEKNYIEKLNEIIDEYKIDFIYPAHDSVVLELADKRDLLNCEVITADYFTCDICRSKKKTYKIFSKISPFLYNDSAEPKEYPIFLKPDVGEGSKGVAKVENKEEIDNLIKKDSSLLILEYLPGKEFTIDCFTDKNKKLIFCNMRERIRTKSGISVNSKTTLNSDSKILEFANLLNEKLNFKGAWFFQVKKDINNNYKLLEVAPRIAGTMCLYRNSGINFPLLSIYVWMDQEVKIINNNLNIEVDRALINRFNVNYDYSTVYVDFDDSLIIKDKINIVLMMFLYQCKNKGKKVILITKHINNIFDSLQKYCISKEIFTKIINLSQNEEKYEYIDEKESIFIDDSFIERYKIHVNCGIPCYDLDMIESLIDWKM